MQMLLLCSGFHGTMQRQMLGVVAVEPCHRFLKLSMYFTEGRINLPPAREELFLNRSS